MSITEFTTKKKSKFIDIFSDCGNVSRSCEILGVSRRSAYNHKDRDPKFAEMWDDAQSRYVEKLEAEADRRATEGLLKKKFLTNGEPVIDPETGKQYLEREYSDTLLIFRLKALAPKRYRENLDVTSAGKRLVNTVVITRSPETKEIV